MKRFQLFIIMAGMFSAGAHGALLFSNGDADSYGNFLDCSTCRAAGGVKIYEDFVVPLGGWSLTGIGETSFFSFNTGLPTQGTWEIRQGLAQNVDGTVIASGTTSLTLTPAANPCACSVFNYSIAAAISPLALAPGTYWVTLAPDSPGNEPLIWAAAGLNGTNALIDGKAFVRGPYWPGMQDVGAYLNPFTHISAYDFAMTLSGTSGVPEPSSMTLGITGLGLLLAGYSFRPRSREAAHISRQTRVGSSSGSGVSC